MRFLLVLVLTASVGLVAAPGCDSDGDGDSDADGDAGPISIAATGAIGDQCAPDDGPALGFVIGMNSSCTGGTGTQPQVHFNAYPGSTDALAAAQSWSFDAATAGQELSAEWFPHGGLGYHAPAISGSVEIVSVAADSADVEYEFVTGDGEPYSGTATPTICHVDTFCG
jgi:hypothetical protein